MSAVAFQLVDVQDLSLHKGITYGYLSKESTFVKFKHPITGKSSSGVCYSTMNREQLQGQKNKIKEIIDQNRLVRLTMNNGVVESMIIHPDMLSLISSEGVEEILEEVNNKKRVLSETVEVASMSPKDYSKVGKLVQKIFK